MLYYGLSSESAVASLFNTSSDTYSLLKAESDYSSYKILGNVASSLKADLSFAPSEDAKTSLQDRLDAIMETIENHAPVKPNYETLSEQAQEQANSILSSLGLGANINTTA